MRVPSVVCGASATAAESSPDSVVKSVSTVTSRLYAMTATGSSSLRCAMNARAAAIAASIGSPAMLFDASMSRTAPLDFEPLSTESPETGPPFSVTSRLFSCVAVGVRYSQTRSGNSESCASVSVGEPPWPVASAGSASAARAAHAIASRRPSFTPLRPCARRVSGRARRTCSAGARCRACGTSRGTRGAGRSASGRR